MTAETRAGVLTARRAAEHSRLSVSHDAYEYLCILAILRSLGPSARLRLIWQIHRLLTVLVPLLRVWVHCQRASNGLLPRRSNLLGYVRWDAQSDRFLLARQSFQQLFRSQSALFHEPIGFVFSREGPQGSLLAFTSGNVVNTPTQPVFSPLQRNLRFFPDLISAPPSVHLAVYFPLHRERYGLILFR